jgi:hypothetical protein
MKRLTAILLALLAVSSMVAADPLYKWVDDQGNVHYSDKPQPGAKQIVLPKPATFVPPPPAARPHGTGSDAPRGLAPGAGSNQEPTAAGYTSLAISSPADQDTLWNTDTVTVNVSLAPALRSGDEVSITLDGNTQSVQGTSATFTGLDRGPHTVTATAGSLKAAPITFYIQKTSIKKPPTH